MEVAIRADKQMDQGDIDGRAVWPQIREGRWEKSRFLGIELCDKTLGIVGLGRIGNAVSLMQVSVSGNASGRSLALCPEGGNDRETCVNRDGISFRALRRLGSIPPL